MATYADLATLKEMIGSTEGLRRVPDSGGDPVLTSKLEVATAMMDEAFAVAGYTTPIDTTGLTNTASLFAHKCSVLAWGLLKPGLTLEKDTLSHAYEECMQWLKDVKAGRTTVPGVANAGRIRFGMADEVALTELPDCEFKLTVV